MNQLAITQHQLGSQVAMTNSAGGFAVTPQTLSDVVEFAKFMCQSNFSVPAFLRGNGPDCAAVIMQAMKWGFDPFSVAQKSYKVKDIIAYEAQLIAAVINARSGIKGRLRYQFDGEGDDLTCTVTGELDGGDCHYTSPRVGNITTKNSPLWKTDPQQQLGYYSARNWARRHCPEVILGAYDRDEAEEFRGPDNAKDVTPSVMQRLRASQETGQNASQAREGFSQGHVARETATLAGEAPTNLSDEPEFEMSPAPSTGDGSGAANPSGEDQPAQPEEGDNPGQVTTDAAPSSALSADDLAWLKLATKMMWAATGKGEQDLLRSTFEAIRSEYTPETIGKLARDKGMAIYKRCKAVCFGEAAAGDVLQEIALIAGCEVGEIAG